MDLFRRKTNQEQSPDQLAHLLERCRERAQAQSDTLRAILIILKEYSFNLSEINADGFKVRIDLLTKQLHEAETARNVNSAFDGHKQFLLDFALTEKMYLDERETELKNIIAMLRDGLSDMIGENQMFNTQMYERNLRVEQLTLLDDIRKIKESLKTEVDQVKRTIMEKQEKDRTRMESLKSEVNVLKSEVVKVTDASMTDGLTGVYNRMAFDMQLQRCIERNAITWKPFTLLLCDIDHFKEINDTHGHPIGDRVLRGFVEECSRLFRDLDFIARYGGDEFIIIMPGMSQRHAVQRACQLGKTLASRLFVTGNEAGPKIRLTVSVGVSEVHKNDTPATLLERADRALYLAKRTGRNRTVCEQEIPRLLKQCESLVT